MDIKDMGQANVAIAELEEIQIRRTNAESRYRAAIQPINSRYANELAPDYQREAELRAALERFCADACAKVRKRSLKFDCGGVAGFNKSERLEFEGGTDEETIVGLLRDNKLTRFIRKKEVPDVAGLKAAIKQSLIAPEIAEACKLVVVSNDNFWVKTSADIAAENMMKPQSEVA